MVDLVSLAREIAIEYHKDQIYDAKPYIYHLDNVYNIVKGRFSEKEEILAYLHDIKEDTEISYDKIVELFGAGMAYSVYLITDCEGNDRKERKIKTNDKLSKIIDKSFYIVLRVKVADRVANMKYSIENKNINMIRMYHKEYAAFKKAVYRKNCCDELWEILDKLSETPI